MAIPGLCSRPSSNESLKICQAGYIIPVDKLLQIGPFGGEPNQGCNFFDLIIIDQFGRIDIHTHPVLYFCNGAPVNRPYTDNGGKDTREACSDQEAKDKAALQV
jgi:hypothetical protein